MLDHARHLDTVQQHVGGAEQMRKLLFLNAPDALGDSFTILNAGCFGKLLLEVVNGGGEETARPTSRIKHDFALFQAGIDPLHHELGDSAWGIELPGVAGAAQVVEDLLVNLPHLPTRLHVVKVDGLVELLDNTQHQGAGFHVVVGAVSYTHLDVYKRQRSVRTV